MPWARRKVTNLGRVTLDANYTAASGTMELTTGDSAFIPTAATFWLAWSEDESDPDAVIHLFRVTGVSGDDVSVTAETAEGGGDTNITAGQILRVVTTIGAVEMLTAYGTYANLPATCSIGDQYITSDSIYTFAGTAANVWTPLYCGKAVTIPSTAGFSWVNQGTATNDTTYGYLRLQELTAGAVNFRMYLQSISAPYTFTTLMRQNIQWANYMYAGLTVRQSSNSDRFFFGFHGRNANLLRCVFFNDDGAGGESVKADRIVSTDTLWLQIRDNSTTLFFEYSIDGNTFYTLYSEANTASITADQIGYGLDNEGTGACALMAISQTTV